MRWIGHYPRPQDKTGKELGMGTVFQKVTEKLTDSHAKGSGLYEAVFIPPYGSQARPQDQPQELLISDTNNWDQFQEKEEPDRSPPPPASLRKHRAVRMQRR